MGYNLYSPYVVKLFPLAVIWNALTTKRFTVTLESEIFLPYVLL